MNDIIFMYDLNDELFVIENNFIWKEVKCNCCNGTGSVKVEKTGYKIGCPICFGGGEASIKIDNYTIKKRKIIGVNYHKNNSEVEGVIRYSLGCFSVDEKRINVEDGTVFNDLKLAEKRLADLTKAEPEFKIKTGTIYGAYTPEKLKKITEIECKVKTCEEILHELSGTLFEDLYADKSGVKKGIEAGLIEVYEDGIVLYERGETDGT